MTINQKFKKYIPKSSSNSIQNVKNVLVWNLFPNPSKDKKISILFSSDRKAEAEITIFNLDGKEIFHKIFDKSLERVDIDLSNHSKGIYIIQNKISGIKEEKKLWIE